MVIVHLSDNQRRIITPQKNETLEDLFQRFCAQFGYERAQYEFQSYPHDQYTSLDMFMNANIVKEVAFVERSGDIDHLADLRRGSVDSCYTTIHEPPRATDLPSAKFSAPPPPVPNESDTSRAKTRKRCAPKPPVVFEIVPTDSRSSTLRADLSTPDIDIPPPPAFQPTTGNHADQLTNLPYRSVECETDEFCSRRRPSGTVTSGGGGGSSGCGDRHYTTDRSDDTDNESTTSPVNFQMTVPCASQETLESLDEHFSGANQARSGEESRTSGSSSVNDIYENERWMRTTVDDDDDGDHGDHSDDDHHDDLQGPAEEEDEEEEEEAKCHRQVIGHLEQCCEGVDEEPANQADEEPSNPHSEILPRVIEESNISVINICPVSTQPAADEALPSLPPPRPRPPPPAAAAAVVIGDSTASQSTPIMNEPHPLPPPPPAAAAVVTSDSGTQSTPRANEPRPPPPARPPAAVVVSSNSAATQSAPVVNEQRPSPLPPPPPPPPPPPAAVRDHSDDDRSAATGVSPGRAGGGGGGDSRNTYSQSKSRSQTIDICSDIDLPGPRHARDPQSEPVVHNYWDSTKQSKTLQLLSRVMHTTIDNYESSDAAVARPTGSRDNGRDGTDSSVPRPQADRETEEPPAQEPVPKPVRVIVREIPVEQPGRLMYRPRQAKSLFFTAEPKLP